LITWPGFGKALSGAKSAPPKACGAAQAFPQVEKTPVSSPRAGCSGRTFTVASYSSTPSYATVSFVFDFTKKPRFISDPGIFPENASLWREMAL
jgi:hypothetical protein